ncbi:MAG: hypothetical protein II903_09305 [Spirochaetales bacterium]|nr:hypothetical protein [Spirochaetales bacterium]
MSENFRETFKAVLLAVLVVLFLPLVLVCCILVGRRSSGSGDDDRGSDIVGAGESVGRAADDVSGAAGQSAELADEAATVAAAAGESAESADDIARQLHDTEEQLVRLESGLGQDINRIERLKQLAAELRRRYQERVSQGQNP